MTQHHNAFVFGSMRVGELSARAATELLVHLLERGVRRFHSSTEYDSFDQFASTLREACARSGCARETLRHVVKVAEPHFGESEFSPSRLAERVAAYADALGVGRVDVVQWMIRHDLDDEPGRLAILEHNLGAIAEAVSTLKREGAIGRFGCFPYTLGMREAVLLQPWCDVLVDYLNPLEAECRASFGMLREKQSVIGIRPLMPVLDAERTAGRGTPSISSLLEYALSDPRVEAVVIGTGRAGHADEILECLGELRPPAPDAPR